MARSYPEATMVDPNETEDTRRMHEVFQSYRRGWKHGACANAPDKRFLDHPRADIASAYDRGYVHGRDAAGLAALHEGERIGYDFRVSILRSPPPTDPPSTESRGEE